MRGRKEGKNEVAEKSEQTAGKHWRHTRESTSTQWAVLHVGAERRFT